MTVLIGLIPALFLAFVALAFVAARAAYRRQAAVDNEMRGAWAKRIGALPICGPPARSSRFAAAYVRFFPRRKSGQVKSRWAKT